MAAKAGKPYVYKGKDYVLRERTAEDRGLSECAGCDVRGYGRMVRVGAKDCTGSAHMRKSCRYRPNHVWKESV